MNKAKRARQCNPLKEGSIEEGVERLRFWGEGVGRAKRTQGGRRPPSFEYTLTNISKDRQNSATLTEISKVKITIWGLLNINSPYRIFMLLKCCFNQIPGFHY